MSPFTVYGMSHESLLSGVEKEINTRREGGYCIFPEALQPTNPRKRVGVPIYSNTRGLLVEVESPPRVAGHFDILRTR